MYSMMAEEVVQDATVATITLLIHSAPIVALFDYGNLHTFIANTFVDRIGVSIKDICYDLVVWTPIGAILTIGICVRGVTVVIQQCIFLTAF